MKNLIIIGMVACLPLQGLAEDEGWYLKAHGGYSQLSDIDTDTAGIAGDQVATAISTNGGFTAGAGIGFRWTQNWALELAWEYRSNETETALADAAQFPDGNLASNAVYLNGYYHFRPTGKWVPYVGAGLGWIQEIDIDLEGSGPEQSYSGDGDTGYQVFAGANYHMTSQWYLQGELRYSRFSNIDLEGEGGSRGSFESIDYDPLTVQLAVIYQF